MHQIAMAKELSDPLSDGMQSRSFQCTPVHNAPRFPSSDAMIGLKSDWARLDTAFRRFGKEFSFGPAHKKLVAEALATGRLGTRIVYVSGGEAKTAEVPVSFWKRRTPLWSARQLRPHLVIDVQELASAVGLPQMGTDICVEVFEEHLLEIERLLRTVTDRDQAPSPPVGASFIQPASIEFGGRSLKHDWRELAAVAANWIADNGPGVPRARLHRLLEEHAERHWKASPDRRDLDRWIVAIQSTEAALPAASSPSANAKGAALDKKGYARAAAIAGAWLHTHGLEAPKSQLEDYLTEWFVAAHSLKPFKQDVKTFVSRVYSLAQAR